MKNFHKENRSGGGRGYGGGRDSDRPARRSFGAGGPTMMHKATCSQCGKDCQLPFKPNGNRAVFCSTCFEEQKNGDSTRPERSFDRPDKKSFGRPDFKDKKMFEALCSNCGNNCLVPFRPIGGKPVFCNKCFDKGDNVVNKNFVVKNENSSPKQVEQFKAQFDMLNIKLDRILREITQGPSFEDEGDEDDEEMDAEEVELTKIKETSVKVKAPKKAKSPKGVPSGKAKK